MSDADARLGQNLKALREAAGLTQAELARHLEDYGFRGMYPQTITRLELGQRSMKTTEAVAIAMVLDVSLQTLCLTEQSVEEMLVSRLVRNADRQLQEVAGTVVHMVRELDATQHNIEVWLDTSELPASLRE